MNRHMSVALTGIGLFSLLLFVIVFLAVNPSDSSPIPTRMVLPTTLDSLTTEPEIVEVAQRSTEIPLLVAEPPTNTPNAVSAQITPIPTSEPIQLEIPPEPVAEQVVIRFDAKTSDQQRLDYIESLNGTVNQRIDALNTVIVNVPASVAEQALPASPIVLSSEPDYYVTALMDVSVPTSDVYYANQWALPAIGVPDAWLEMPSDARSVVVAVIDSGICLNHPDLQGRIGSGWDFVEDDAVPQDDFGHGCGVAGIIAANIDNGIGIAGVAPNAQIMPLRVLDSSGMGTYSDVAAAIVYAADHGAQIINLSLGGSNSSTILQDAIDYAIAKEVMVIAAAGNTGSNVLYPAKYASVIAVGSLDQNLQASSFSANDPEVDVWAPGRDILMTAPNASYTTMSGTSFAAPYVSGQKVLELVGVTISIVTEPPVEPETPISTNENTGPKPLPLDQQSPLRIMVPYENANQQLDVLSLAQRFPNLDIERSFSPGPRMEAAVAPNSPFKMLAILVDFSDNTASVSPSFYDSLLFGTTQPSVRHYYDEVSYSQLDIVSVSADQPGTLGWQRAPQSYAYYVGSDDCTGTYPNNCQKLTEDLVAQVDSLVDFSQYDNDNDGYVDTLFVIHAGAGAETHVYGIWSHSSWTVTQPLVDGVRVGNYVTVPEYRASPDDSTIGVFVHELGHAFGLPDFYDYDESPVEDLSQGIGNWSLMASGSWNGPGGDGSSPAHLDAWSKLYLDWTTEVVVSPNQSLSIPNVEQNGINVIYRINNPTQPNEYFLLENRQQVLYDAYLPSHGLLIWHVDDASTSNNKECEEVNNWLCTQRYHVALEQADGLSELELNLDQGDAGDPFPGTSNNTSFTFTTNPNTSSYYSSDDLGFSIKNISESGGIVSVDVLISPTIVINEVDTSDSSAIELYNASGRAIDLGGWYINAFDPHKAVNEAGYVVSYIIPTGFTLQPDSYVVLHEGSGSNTATDLYINATIDWEHGKSGAVLLNNGNVAIDFVRWGWKVNIVPPISTGWTGDNPQSPNTGVTLSRDPSSTDTDDGADWGSRLASLGQQNPFVHFDNRIYRVSVSNDGTQANSESRSPFISGDGQYVGFENNATSLVADDLGNTSDIFVYDLENGTIKRIQNRYGTATDFSSISADGHYIAFSSYAVEGIYAQEDDIFFYDVLTDEYYQVTAGYDGLHDDESFAPVISGDGTHIAFWSKVTNLVANDFNGINDAFVYDIATQEFTRVTVASNGTEANLGSTGFISIGPSISTDGRYVAFSSTASNLLVDGSDTNGRSDIFVHDTTTGSTTRVSVATDGSQSAGASTSPHMSGDGRYVVFRESNDDLADGDSNGKIDIVIHDTVTGETTLISVASDGTQANNSSDSPSISADGRYVAFTSYATNLVDGANNGKIHVYVHDRVTGQTIRVSHAADGALANQHVTDPAISADGQYVAFLSSATNLAPDDTNGVVDTFVARVIFPPLNEDFDDATPITLGSLINETQTTSGATSAGDDPTPSCGVNIGSTIWYEYTPTVDETLTASTVGSDYDTVLSIWTGTRGNLTEVACNDDYGPEISSHIDFDLTTGTTYYIMVGGYNGASGNLVLNVTEFTTTGFVQGTVYESNGVTPITTQAWVTALDSITGDWIADVSVEADGTYQIELEAGTYRLHSTAVDHVQEFYDNAAQSFDSATEITVAISSTVTGIDFSLDPAGSISGVVTDESDTPLANVGVTVEGTDIGACTDENGVYHLYGVPLNTPYIVQATGNSWCSDEPSFYLNEYWQETSDENEATSITLSVMGEEAADINFTLTQGGAISGTIYTDNGTTPITDNAWANVQDANTGYWLNGVGVNEEGTYLLNLPSGEYLVFADAYDRVREYYDNAGGFPEDATHVTVIAGAIIEGIDFSLDPAGSISGVVTDENDIPLANVGVTVEGTDIGACTDENGSYHLYGVPLNTPYIVQATGNSWCNDVPVFYLNEYWQETSDENEATSITLSVMGEEAADINFTLTQGGIISGTILDSDSNNPITENAWINVFDVATGYWLAGTYVQTDGTYYIALDAGEYLVEAFAYDHISEYYDNVQFGQGNNTPVTVIAGQNTSGIDFSLDPAGSISGMVTDTIGTPLANVGVTVEGTDIGACTDENGLYHIYGVPLNTPYIIQATGNSWCNDVPVFYLNEYWQETSNDYEATPITLSVMGEEAADINFTLTQGGAISGIILESNNSNPITENAWINVFDAATENWVAGTYVQTDGTYHIALDAGEYLVEVFAYDYISEYYDNVQFGEGNNTPVTVVTGQNTSGIDFSLDPAGSISGVVTDESDNPLANVGVTIEGTDIGACTDENGAYHLYQIPLNTPYVVHAYGNSGCDNAPYMYPGEYWQDAPSETEATPITVYAKGEEVANIDFTLALGGAISGYIFEANGTTPITENAWVTVLYPPTGDFVNGTQVNSDGSYRITVPVGDYILSADAYDRALEYYDNAGPNFDNGNSVTVTAGLNTSDINFSLDPAGSISGIVTDTVGNPLPNIPVSISDTGLATCTDANGYFRIWSVPVGFSAIVYAGGNDNWCGGSDFYIGEYWNDVTDYDAATPVIVPSVTVDIPDVNFALTLGSSISGVVRASEDSSPLENVWVCAFSYDAAHFDETDAWNCEVTEADGTYFIGPINPVAQRVWIFPDDRIRLFYNNSSTFGGASSVNLTPGYVHTGVDFSLPLAGIITGTIYDRDGVTPLAGVTITTGTGEYPECSQADGSYRIFVPAGTHTVMAGEGICNSTVDFTPQYYGQTINLADATPVTVSSTGTVIENIDFVNANFIDLALTMSDTPDPVKPGDTLTYTLTVANQGLDTATDVVLTNTLPSGITFASGIANQGTGCGAVDNIITCNLGSLSPLANTTVTIEVTIEPGPAATLTNVASVTANAIETNSENNASSKTIIVDAPPLAPSGLTASMASRSEISLSWQDNSHDETLFFIERSADGNNWSELARVAGNQTTYMDQGLRCSTVWMYRVRAYRGGDNATSGYSDVASSSTECPPLVAPSSLLSQPLSRTQVNLSWVDNSPGEVTQFHIERSTDGSNWTRINILNGRYTAYSDTGLICGTTYSYRVRVYREEDKLYSGYSDVTSTTTDTCPDAVTNTVGLYKDGNWMFRDSNDGGLLDLHFIFGPQEPGWTPLVGDWNGDGVDGIGLYKDGTWIFRNNNDNGPLDMVIYFSMPGTGWLPLVGDWNGDDIDTPALYKNGTVAIKNINLSGPADARYVYGPQETGWLPIAGDWNGSGTDTVSFYKAGQWIIYNGFTNSSYAIRFNYGPAEASWIPLAGDWDQNLSDTIGLYRAGNWRLRNSNNAGVVDLGFSFGTQASGWQPVASYRGGAGSLTVMGMAPINPLTGPTQETPVPTVINQPEVTPEPTSADQPEITPEVTLPPSETPEPTATDQPEATLPPTIAEPTTEPTQESVEASPTPEPTIDPTEMPTTPVPETTDEPTGQ